MIFDHVLDLFRGKAVTIPPLDGALKPNTALDDAEVVRSLPAPDNLAVIDGRLTCTSGANVVDLVSGQTVFSAEAEITALAVFGGQRAYGFDTGKVKVERVEATQVLDFTCPTALAFGADGLLYVCNGSDACPPSGWTADLMSKNAKGSIWSVNPETDERRQLATGLAYPSGIAVDEANGLLLVSEAWRHRVIAIPKSGGPPRDVLAKLPGYPSRLSAAPGGYVMSLFAPRNRLIEFVLLEEAYRADMMREIPKDYWIAPSLSPASSFLEPLQNGGVKTMGIHKPWSPTRSYGLVIGLDERLQPTMSFHSRANGSRHGVTSTIAAGGAIYATSKGGNVVLKIPMSSEIQ